MNVKTRRWIAGCIASPRPDETGGRLGQKLFKALAIAIAVLVLPSLAIAEASDEQPQVSDVRFDPARPLSGEKIKMYLTLKNAVRAELKWTVNGEDEQLMDYDGISGHVEFDKSLTAGDTLKVAITPYNGLSEPGKTLVRSVKIRNAPPTLRLARQELKDRTYVAKIDVQDPEKGKVTLKVLGPQGMGIDDEGNITWRIKKGVQGNFPVKVIAKDEHGAQSELTYAVRIRQAGGR